MDPHFTKAQLDMQERINILPEELTALITGGGLDATVFTLQEKYGLTDEQKVLLENEIILVLTLFLSKQAFEENVRESLGVDEETANGIARAVNESLFELVDDILSIVESARKELNAVLGKIDLGKKLERREDLAKLAESFAQPDPARLQSGETKQQGSEVEPIRTMAEDMNRVHGYGAYRAQEEKRASEDAINSSQDDLLKKEQPENGERG